MTDPSEIGPEEHHPAANAAYRWLKGFMVSNAKVYAEYRDLLAIAAAAGNRQAQICTGTIKRLQAGQPVSDRYLLGLAWTILHMHNHEAMEGIAQLRIDRAYPPDETEYKQGE